MNTSNNRNIGRNKEYFSLFLLFVSGVCNSLIYTGVQSLAGINDISATNNIVWALIYGGIIGNLIVAHSSKYVYLFENITGAIGIIFALVVYVHVVICGGSGIFSKYTVFFLILPSGILFGLQLPYYGSMIKVKNFFLVSIIFGTCGIITIILTGLICKGGGIEHSVLLVASTGLTLIVVSRVSRRRYENHSGKPIKKSGNQFGFLHEKEIKQALLSFYANNRIQVFSIASASLLAFIIHSLFLKIAVDNANLNITPATYTSVGFSVSIFGVVACNFLIRRYSFLLEQKYKEAVFQSLCLVMCAHLAVIFFARNLFIPFSSDVSTKTIFKVFVFISPRLWASAAFLWAVASVEGNRTESAIGKESYSQSIALLNLTGGLSNMVSLLLFQHM